MRHLVNAPVTLDHTFTSDEASVDPGDVTVEVARDDGTTVETSEASGTGTQARMVTIAAGDNTQVDRLTVVWTSTTLGSRTEHAEIVGGHYVTLPEIRAAGDVDDHPVADLRRAREWAETLIDRYVGTAFTPRYGRYDAWGSGTAAVLLPSASIRRLLWASVDGSLVTDLADWTVYGYGQASRASVFPTSQQVSVGYEYGHDAPPADIAEVALILSRYWLLERRQRMFDRGRAVATDYGVEYLSTPGPDRPTGLPGVDAVLNSYRDSERVPTVA